MIFQVAVVLERRGSRMISEEFLVLSSIPKIFRFVSCASGKTYVQWHAHKESNFSISACEYEAPITVVDFVDDWRAVGGRVRQNGEADRLNL
jgi:hypothetical protein